VEMGFFYSYLAFYDEEANVTLSNVVKLRQL
jgi:hypothetical protein